MATRWLLVTHSPWQFVPLHPYLWDHVAVISCPGTDIVAFIVYYIYIHNMYDADTISPERVRLRCTPNIVNFMFFFAQWNAIVHLFPPRRIYPVVLFNAFRSYVRFVFDTFWRVNRVCSLIIELNIFVCIRKNNLM